MKRAHDFRLVMSEREKSQLRIIAARLEMSMADAVRYAINHVHEEIAGAGRVATADPNTGRNHPPKGD